MKASINRLGGEGDKLGEAGLGQPSSPSQAFQTVLVADLASLVTALGTRRTFLQGRGRQKWRGKKENDVGGGEWDTNRERATFHPVSVLSLVLRTPYLTYHSTHPFSIGATITEADLNRGFMK